VKKDMTPTQSFENADQILREFMPGASLLESEPPKGINEEAQALVDSLLSSVRNKGHARKYEKKRLTR
jgi:hypothetical protein